MLPFLEYYGRFQGVRGSLLGLPAWARLVLFLFALPGLLALALSIAAVLCSLAALLLLTLPVYRLLRLLTAGGQPPPFEAAPMAGQTPGRRQVDVRIIE